MDLFGDLPEPERSSAAGETLLPKPDSLAENLETLEKHIQVSRLIHTKSESLGLGPESVNKSPGDFAERAQPESPDETRVQNCYCREHKGE